MYYKRGALGCARSLKTCPVHALHEYSFGVCLRLIPCLRPSCPAPQAPFRIFLTVVVGLVAGTLIGAATEYSTSSAYYPVQVTAVRLRPQPTEAQVAHVPANAACASTGFRM